MRPGADPNVSVFLGAAQFSHCTTQGALHAASMQHFFVSECYIHMQIERACGCQLVFARVTGAMCRMQNKMNPLMPEGCLAQRKDDAGETAAMQQNWQELDSSPVT